MKKEKKVIWGIVLIVVGILFLLRAVDILPFDLFFDGWWTLILIVPAAVDLFTKENKGDAAIGLLIGTLLLLACQGVVTFSLLVKLFVPVLVVIAGVKLLFGAFGSDKAKKVRQSLPQSEASYFACFSGQDVSFEGQNFCGASLDAVFGGIECDLRGAVIEKDATIRVSAIFGGVDLLVPPHVVVKTSVTGIFGGTSNKATRGLKDAPTLYVTGLCMFGGVEIK